MEYGATVVTHVTFPGATISGDTVSFPVSDLEDDPTEFEAVLDTCGVPEPVIPVVSITYSDEGNSPDFTEVLVANGSTCPPGMLMANQLCTHTQIASTGSTFREVF